MDLELLAADLAPEVLRVGENPARESLASHGSLALCPPRPRQQERGGSGPPPAGMGVALVHPVENRAGLSPAELAQPTSCMTMPPQPFLAPVRVSHEGPEGILLPRRPVARRATEQRARHSRLCRTPCSPAQSPERTHTTRTARPALRGYAMRSVPTKSVRRNIQTQRLEQKKMRDKSAM